MIITFNASINHIFVVLVVLLFNFIVVFKAIGFIKFAISYEEFEQTENKTTIAKIIYLVQSVKMLIMILLFFALVAVFFIDNMTIDSLLKNYASGLFLVLTIIFFFLTLVSFVF